MKIKNTSVLPTKTNKLGRPNTMCNVLSNQETILSTIRTHTVWRKEFFSRWYSFSTSTPIVITSLLSFPFCKKLLQGSNKISVRRNQIYSKLKADLGIQEHAWKGHNPNHASPALGAAQKPAFTMIKCQVKKINK